MEVGETLTKLPNREKHSDIERNAFTNVVDIISSKEPVLTHRSFIEKRDLVFEEGLISEAFAKRAGRKDFQVQIGGVGSVPEGLQIWFYKGPKLFKSGGERIDDLFGIIIRPPENVYYPDGEKIEQFSYESVHASAVVVTTRIAPREFVGLMLYEDQTSLGKNVGKLVHSMRRRKLALPIYNTSGDLLWPKRMSHEEIVQMLAERKL